MWDRDLLKPDDRQGDLKLPVRAVLEGRGPGGGPGSLVGWFPLQKGSSGAARGEVELRLRFMVHDAGLA